MPANIQLPLPVFTPPAYIDVAWFGTGNGSWASSVYTFTDYNGETPNFVTNEYTGYYIAYGSAKYKIDSNTTNSIAVSGGPGSGNNPAALSSNPSFYEIQWWEYKTDGTPDNITRTIIPVVTFDETFSAIAKSSYSIGGLKIGTKYGVRVRSCYGNTEIEKSAWSATEDIIAGIGEQIVMSAVQATSINGGIRLTWSAVTGASQYKIVWNTDGKPAEQSGQNRDYTNVTEYNITQLEPGTMVYAGVYAIDAAGQLSSNISIPTPAATVAGGTVSTTNEKVRDIYINTAFADGVKRVLIPKLFFNKAAYITKVALNVDGYDFYSQTSPPVAAKIRFYPFDNPSAFQSLIFYEGDDNPVGDIGLQLNSSTSLTVDALDSASPNITFSGLLSIYYEEGVNTRTISLLA